MQRVEPGRLSPASLIAGACAVALILAFGILPGGQDTPSLPRPSHGAAGPFDQVPGRMGLDSATPSAVMTPGAATAAATDYVPVPAVSLGTSTVLVLDTSASMRDPVADATMTKLEAAKVAAGNVLDIILVENQASPSEDHKVAVVSYSDLSYVNAPLSNKIPVAREQLDNLYTTGQTAMPKGLKAALELLPVGAKDRQIVILLSDGLPNVGLNDEMSEDVARQQVLDLALEAGRRGICVYTVGFGDPASGTIDEDFLEATARNSGCGTYQNAQSAWQLANIYINLRHSSAGNVLLQKSGEIEQDETQTIADISVPENQEMLLFTLHWRGGRLQPTLTDSLGQAVGPGSPGVFFSTTETLASILVQNPLPGQWSVSAYGADLPDGKTAYQVVLSVRAAAITPAPQPRTSTGRVQLASPQAPVMGMVLFVILTAATVLVITQRSRRGIRRRAVARGPVARLVGVSGAVAGRTDWIQDDFIIGSGPGCSLALVDPSVSYQHVRIRFFAGRWFIQGLDFRNETRVNGVPVRASALRDGDRVKIGPYEFIFQIR